MQTRMHHRLNQGEEEKVSSRGIYVVGCAYNKGVRRALQFGRALPSNKAAPGWASQKIVLLVVNEGNG